MNVEITFEGTGGGTYTVPEDMAKYIDSDLVNRGYNGTIYLMPVNQTQESRGTYVGLGFGIYPRLYNDSVYGYTVIRNASNVHFNPYGEYQRQKPIIDAGLIFILMFFLIVRLFKN